LVTAGNMTCPGCDAYLLVVSFRTLRLAMLLGELNLLNLMVGDVTSAYLMAMTKELIFFKAGPEFMEKEGHLMIIWNRYMGFAQVESHGMIYWSILLAIWASNQAMPTKTYGCETWVIAMNMSAHMWMI
jgi:hypothetical protein